MPYAARVASAETDGEAPGQGGHQFLATGVRERLGAELLFDVISTAYERSGVIVTTNLPFEQWSEVLGSERPTGATLDRLTHRCSVIETGVESYRLRDARRRRRGASKETREEAQA